MNVPFPYPTQIMFDLYYSKHKLNNRIPRPQKTTVKQKYKMHRVGAVYKYVYNDDNLAEFDT